MDFRILSALIAGIVSLVVSLGSLWATRYKIESEKQKQERELERKLTEKLYERRMDVYPKAFSITSRLLGHILQTENISRNAIQEIYNQISEWSSSDANFLLSKKSLKAYYRLRDSLLVEPEIGDNYSKIQREEMWKSKNKLRPCLVDDLKLLFKEENKNKK